MNIPQHVVSRSVNLDIELLLSQLSPELREVAILRFIEDLSYQGVAARLGCPLWKARKLISELLRTLRQLCGVQVLEIAPGYEVRYFPQFLSGSKADLWFSRLLSEVPFQPEKVSMCGKQLVLRRQTAQYGKNYDYNPSAQEAQPWLPLLTDLRFLVEQAARMRFDSGLCNLYLDGEAYIGWHRDANHPKVIASLSLAAARELLFAEGCSTHPVFRMELGHGSLVLIPQSVNERYRHMVPKSKQVTQPRINITFRRF
jgi:alkylated DNA repair dioxygenase AlkB